RSAAEGEHDMSQSTLRRGLTAGALAAVLVAAGAAPAGAHDPVTAGRAWLWIQDIWMRGISTVGYPGGEPKPSALPSREKEKGMSAASTAPAAPNSPAPSPPGPGSSACGSCDQGYGVDPDG
ncbi:MAG TPA: hypothetical protein VF173_10345, partial [Thermoanaerobaculia bacterium]|nr:hypothetical protein [Thermoanaerobaculia bacterium]